MPYLFTPATAQPRGPASALSRPARIYVELKQRRACSDHSARVDARVTRWPDAQLRYGRPDAR